MAILTGILLPSLSKMRETAMKTVCASNLRQIGIAIEAYVQENQQTYPVARYMPDPFLSIFQDDPGLPDALEHEMPTNSEVYACPGDDGQVFNRAGTSYTYNASLAGQTLDKTWFSRWVKFDKPKIPVAYDCDGNNFLLFGNETITVPPFHTLRNLLFADGRVGNY